MEDFDMKEFLRIKLLELKYQKKLMTMDKKFTKEDLEDMDRMIKEVKREYSRNLVEEYKEKQEKNDYMEITQHSTKNQCFNDETKEEMRKYLKTNDHENTTI